MIIPSERGWYSVREITSELPNVKVFPSRLLSKEEETVNIALLDALGCQWLAVCPWHRHHQPRDPVGQLKS